MNLNYHQNPDILHVGCEEPHAYLIPYQSNDCAGQDVREDSDRFGSLCGEWDFRFFSSVDEVADPASLSVSQWDSLTVPMSWQMMLDRGYDKPFYDDTNYPIPVDPPYVPRENPCGLYRRFFKIDGATLKEQETYLVFEGVDSCFYLYINGYFVGYSQVSHSTSEFLISKYLIEGINEIRVLVLKWCDGTYLEDQDKIRLSGIFREVYLLHRDPIHIRDLYIRTTVSDTLDEAEIAVQVEITGEKEITYELLDVTKNCLDQGTIISKNGKADFKIAVKDPMLWSDETPFLYKLFLTCGEEHFCQFVGIRRYEIIGRVIYVNGKAVKAKGMNRHDSHPEHGAAVSMEDMLRDLYILKANNVNMIRTAHYPNDPRFLGLCDKLGFYVCDEADVESHGMDFAEGYGRNSLSDDPAWTKAYVDRGRRLMESDKNHACVIMWSVGNESGIGQNLKAIADYFHSRIPGCIVHSERYNYIEHLLSMKNPEVEGFERYLEEPYIDIDSRMYASPEDCLRKYVEDEKRVRPYFLCEFCHAMGNGPGDLAAYWDLIWKYDCFFGGCIWEFCDHTVNAGTPEEPIYLYGGDFGDIPNGANFCTDGMVYPNRRLHSGMLEYKQVIRPCIMTQFDQKTGEIRLFNRKYFTDLSDLDLYWTVEINGVKVKEGRITGLDIPPHEEKCYELPIRDLILDSEYCYLNLFFQTNETKPWAEEGHEVGKEQVRLAAEPISKGKFIKGKPQIASALTLEETDAIFVVHDGEIEYRIDRLTGNLFRISENGQELLASPVKFNLWRAPTDNDRNLRIEWEKCGFDRMWIDCRYCGCEECLEQKIVITAALAVCAASLSVLADVKVRYTWEPGLGVKLSYEVTMRREQEVSLPRLGIEFMMPAGFENLRYFGLGPMESYQDKRQASIMGLFSTTVSDHFEPYIKPQENMAHADTVWTEVSDGNGRGMRILKTEGTAEFSFNCSHYTPMQLTKTLHHHELTPLAETVLNVDWKQCGVGSNSCGPKLAEEYALKDRFYAYSFRLIPFKGETDPFDII